MKFLYLAAVAIFTISTANITHAATKTVTINWNTSGLTEDIQSYRMIYSYSSDMSNPIEACETTDNTDNTLTCEGIEITSENVYFRIVATTTQTTVWSNTQQVTIPIGTTISMVQGFQVVSPSGIFDDFSTDSANQYHAMTGGIFIENNAAHGQVWNITKAFHTTSLGSSNHYAEANVFFNGSSQGGGLLVRVDPDSQTGYLVHFENGSINLESFAGASRNWLAQYNGAYSEGTYKIKVLITDNQIKIFVDEVLVIDRTDTTYTSGNYAGLYVNQGGGDANITVDNFSAQKL